LSDLLEAFCSESGIPDFFELLARASFFACLLDIFNGFGDDISETVSEIGVVDSLLSREHPIESDASRRFFICLMEF